MKTFNKNIKRLSVVALSALALTACTDDNDWGTDGAFDRMFSPYDISVESYDTKAALTFKTIQGASGYQVELSTDTLTDEQPEIAANSIVATLKSSPDTIYNLNGETRYFLRIRTMSDMKPNSKWYYFKSGSGQGAFKTKAEQIFYDVTASDFDDSTIRVKWDTSKEATTLVAMIGDEEIARHELTAEDKAAGEYTFAGLRPTTTYTLYIYNGDVKRGSLNVTTAAAMPAANYKVTLPVGTTVISQDLINEIAEQAKAAAGSETNYSATIGIPAGSILDMHGLSEEGSNTSVKLPDGMSVTFFGLAGGDAPVFNLSKSFDIQGSHAFVHFENLVINDKGCEYFINQSAVATVADLQFKDVRFNDLSRSIVRFQNGAGAKTINKLTLDNVFVNKQGKGGYALLYFQDAAHTIGEINVKNSTFSGLTHNFIQTKGSAVKLGVVNIESSTFYNVIGAGRYFVDANGISTEVNVSNVILAKTNSDSAKGIRTTGTVTFSNVWMAKDFVLSSNASDFKQANEFDGVATDLFTDPDNGDFTMKRALDGAGDPEWFPTE